MGLWRSIVSAIIGPFIEAYSSNGIERYRQRLNLVDVENLRCKVRVESRRAAIRTNRINICPSVRLERFTLMCLTMSSFHGGDGHESPISSPRRSDRFGRAEPTTKSVAVPHWRSLCRTRSKLEYVEMVRCRGGNEEIRA